MDGKVWVTSELGVGSVFQLEIPYQASSALKLPPPPLKDLLGKRILVVDDNQTVRDVITAYLTRWKFSPHAVASAQEAFPLIKAEHWDAILLDAQMPGMNGVELAFSIQQLLTDSAPPMILLNAGTAPVKEAFGPLASPLAAIVTKPLRRYQLQRILVQVLNGTTEPERAAGVKLLSSDFAQRTPLRILLAEDNPVNQKVALRMLERLGYRVDAASNGLEVLQALDRQGYDVVLMDVQMPEMNGLDATRHIIARYGQNRPWITALTAGAMKENRDESLAAGVDDFLTKPINVQELKEALREMFSQSRNRS